MNQDLLEVLNNTRFITLSTVNDDGSPWATPIGWFGFDAENNRIVFDNETGTIHAANLQRDSRCIITMVNHDKEYTRAVYVPTLAKKLTGEDFEKAKKFLPDRGVHDENDIFAASIGEINVEKSRIGLVGSGGGGCGFIVT